MISGNPLSRREREIAQLVASGLTNREIAQRLFISERTAEGHVQSIRNKLGFTSRTQIAAWTVQQPEVPVAPSHELSTKLRATTTPRLATARTVVQWRLVAGVASSAVVIGAVIGILLLRTPAATSDTIATYAGNGISGWAGDGGRATAADVAPPTAVATDPSRNLYIVSGNAVRQVSSQGIITTVAGSGVPGYAGDGGSAAQAKFSLVPLGAPVVAAHGIAVDDSGDVYIADSGNNRVRRLDINGTVRTVAGTGADGFAGDAGPAALAALADPRGIIIDRSGNLLIADTGNDRIRKVDRSGVITTVAGTGRRGFSGDGGSATAADLNTPIGLAVGLEGETYVADAGNHRVRRISAEGSIQTVAGTGEPGFSGDGTLASRARLSFPVSVAISPSGNLYIADSGNNRVRRIDLRNNITTLAGTGESGFGGDGGPARSGHLHSPLGVAVDSSGAVYIADSGNNRVRRVG